MKTLFAFARASRWLALVAGGLAAAIVRAAQPAAIPLRPEGVAGLRLAAAK